MYVGATTVRIGLGGWEHEALDDVFYPRPGLSPEEKLQVYARHFDTVEVRATFWDETLTVEDGRRWADAVAGSRSFLFNVKLPASITHKKTLQPGTVRRMLEILGGLSSWQRLGSVIAQFPYSFTNTSGNRFHLARVAEVFAGFPVCAEFRHESWNQSTLFSFLAQHNLLAVNGDLPRIRQFMPFFAGVTGKEAYLRLHGRNEKGWLLNGLDMRYDYLYNSKEIQELRRRIEAGTRSCRTITAIFNNTTGGKALANALQMQSAILDGHPVPVPLKTLKSFPVLRAIADPHPAEMKLFESEGFRVAG